MTKSIAVIGAGSWGTALASVLADNGHKVCLWARKEEVAHEINTHHTNSKYLKDVTLSKAIVASSSLEEVLSGKDAVVLVVPSQAFRDVVTRAKSWIQPDTLVIHATKGFEVNTWKRMSEILCEELGSLRKMVVLSGPSHAEEVIRKCPTTVVVASPSQEAAEHAQTLFMNSYFRVYTNPDWIGVEVGGALKNIIALAAGLCDGLGFGDNARAALLTRGLAEISRLGVKMGAQPITFVGLAGVGDLVATCTSRHSRNWRVGHMISQGKKLRQILKELGMVAEGVKTTQVAYAMARKYGVRMPITEQLYQVLFHDKDPTLAAWDLMKRGRTQELEEVLNGW